MNKTPYKKHIPKPQVKVGLQKILLLKIAIVFLIFAARINIAKNIIYNYEPINL